MQNEKGFKDELNRLREAKADVISAPIYYNTMMLVARDAKALGFSGREFFRAEGAEFTNHWTMDMPSPFNRTFVTAYQAEFDPHPSSVAALSFDAAMLSRMP